LRQRKGSVTLVLVQITKEYRSGAYCVAIVKQKVSIVTAPLPLRAPSFCSTPHSPHPLHPSSTALQLYSVPDSLPSHTISQGGTDDVVGMDEAMVSELAKRRLVADTACQACAPSSELHMLATLDNLDQVFFDQIPAIDTVLPYDCDATSIFMTPDQYDRLASATSMSIGACNFNVEKIKGMVIISESDRMVIRIEEECE
jgi:hypothetical protein